MGGTGFTVRGEGGCRLRELRGTEASSCTLVGRPPMAVRGLSSWLLLTESTSWPSSVVVFAVGPACSIRSLSACQLGQAGAA